MACNIASTARLLTTMIVALTVGLAAGPASSQENRDVEPSTSEPATVGPVKVDIPESVRPQGACDEEVPGEDALLERVRRRLTTTACASSAWLDSLFGDQFHYDDYRATYGSVSTGLLWSEYDGFDPRMRFRVRLQLPQWDERISAFAGRVGEDDFISDTENEFNALPTRQFGNLEDESVLIGLGYSKIGRAHV